MPVFVDEAIYIHWSQGMWNGEKLKFLSLMDGKQPLFMLLSIPSLAVFSDPLFAGRFISVLAGLFTLAGIYLFSKEFLNKLIAITASALYILSPFTFFYDRLAVADGLLTTFGIWSLYFSYKILKSKHIKYTFLLSTTFALALWTKTPAMFYLILTFFTPLLNLKAKAGYWSKWLFSCLLGIGFYNLLRFSKGFWMIGKRNADYVYSLKEIIDKGIVDPFWPNFTSSISWLISYLTVGFALFSFLGIFYVIYKKHKTGLLLLLWFVTPIIAGSFVSKAFTARYILISVPFIIITASIFFERIIHTLGKPVGLIIFIIFSVPAFSFNYHLINDIENAPIPQRERSGYLEEWSSGYGIKDVSDYLIDQSNKTGGAKIYVMTEGYVGTLPDGINIYTSRYKNIEAFGIGWPVGSLPNNLSEYLKNGHVYLVVNQSRMLLPKVGNLSLIAKYPKPKGPSGQDYLLFYKVMHE